MKETAWLFFLLLGSLAAEPRDLELCARVGVARPVDGTAIELGAQQSPVYWGFVRDVRFQVCTNNGRPVAGRRRLQLIVERERESADTESISPSEVWTDEQGRFTTTYGGGSLRAGLPWPPENSDPEWHEFRLAGRTVAIFQVQRTSDDLVFFRPGPEALAKRALGRQNVAAGGR